LSKSAATYSTTTNVVSTSASTSTSKAAAPTNVVNIAAAGLAIGGVVYGMM